MNERIQNILRQERGAATIIEYTIVFPIVILVIFALIFMGFIMYDRAVLEAQVEKTALYAASTLENPNFAKAAKWSDDSAYLESIAINSDNISNDPYRYLLGYGSRMNDVAKKIEREATDQVRNRVLSVAGLGGEPSIEVEIETGLANKVTVTGTETYETLSFLSMIGLDTSIDIVAQTSRYASQPSEQIRNIDFAVDIISDALGATGVNVEEVRQKIGAIGEKLSLFREKTGQ